MQVGPQQSVFKVDTEHQEKNLQNGILRRKQSNFKCGFYYSHIVLLFLINHVQFFDFHITISFLRNSIQLLAIQVTLVINDLI